MPCIRDYIQFKNANKGWEKYMKGKLGLGLTLFGLLKMRVGMIIKEGVIFFMLHNNYTQ